MSHPVRRTVTALALAGILAAAAQPVTARDLRSRRPAAPDRAALAQVADLGVPGLLDLAWSWLRQAWMAGSTPVAPPAASPPPPPCGSDPSCQTSDEGPIIDPNGHH